jgi:hypothetical protein
VVLSFAQFERELVGERVRDKIAASKRKRIWVGGPVPLGYAAVDKRSLWLQPRLWRFARSLRAIWSLVPCACWLRTSIGGEFAASRGGSRPGNALILAFAIVFGGWGYFAPLDEARRAV